MLDDRIVKALWDRGLLTEGQSLQSDVDIAIINGSFMAPNAVAMLRPALYAHTFNLHPSLINKMRVADRIFHASLNTAAGMGIRGLVFHVHRDNERMRKWIEGKGAVCEPDSVLYRFDLPFDFQPRPYKEPHAQTPGRSNLRSFPNG